MKSSIPLCLFLISCGSAKDQIAPNIPTTEDSLAKHYIATLADADLARARTALDPQIRGANADSGLLAIVRELNGRRPTELRPLNYQVAAYDHTDIRTIIYEGRLHGRWALYQISFAGAKPPFTVAGVHLQLREESLEDANALRLAGKPFVNYLLSFLAVVNVGFIIFTLALVLRTPAIKKWRWFLASLVGFGSMQLNWTTGVGNFQPISVVLLGVALTRPGLLQPWILQVAFPIGAILFHVRRRELRKQTTAESESTAQMASVESGSGQYNKV